jgi:large subunit ribosomal protein L6
MSITFATTKPVQIPGNVEVQLTGSAISVKGPLGYLCQEVDSQNVKLVIESGVLSINAVQSSKHAKAIIGTIRSLIINMIVGVTNGFEKRLQLVGVGYRAQVSGNNLNLSLGFSHPVIYNVPEDIKAETPTQTEICIKGIDKQKVGQVAADIRAFRRPEPYKGKGIRFSDEKIVIKETKKK